jgi:hypothetical protein
MAGDWIKMRMDLQTHPKIVRIMSATSSDKFRVIGGLHAVWCVFDQHSIDGLLKGYSPELMDQIIGWDGFSRAMVDVGWLAIDIHGFLQMPEFSEHNGKSSKIRAEDSKRKKQSRNNPESSGQKSDKYGTRVEKRRVNKNNKPKPPVFPIPEDFALSAELIAYAAKQGVNDRLELEDFTEGFINSCKAKPYLYADFNCAWKTWFRNRSKNGGKNGPTNHTPKLNAFDRSKQKLAEWEAANGGIVLDGQALVAND